MKTYSLLTIACLIATFSTVFGQDPDNLGRLERQTDELNRRNRQESLEEMKRHTTPYRFYKQNPKVEIKKIEIALAPPAQDLEKYKNFLRQSKTGLFRLKPNFECNQEYLVRVDGDCQNSLPIGEFYSFRTRDYSLERFSDLTFKDGKFISRKFPVQGILVSLGNIPLENVSLDSAGIKFLVDFKPAKESSEVIKQFRKIAQGVDFNGFHYASSLSAAVNTTYAFRIIAYRIENQIRFWRNDERFSRDKRIDLTVAFRVIRKESDGSLIILWKELNRQKAPKMVFQKKGKFTDISQE